MFNLPNKFIVTCQECKQPMLKENPACSKNNLAGNFSAICVKSKEVVVLPNVYCPHCKAKNVLDSKSRFVDTEKMTDSEKADFEKSIKDAQKKPVKTTKIEVSSKEVQKVEPIL